MKIEILGNAAGKYGFHVVNEAGKVTRGPFMGLASEDSARSAAIGYVCSNGGFGVTDAGSFPLVKIP